MTGAHEFTFQVPAVKVGAEPYKTSFVADARACAQLAKRYGIVSVEAVAGQVTLMRGGDGMTIGATGHFSADVTQSCVTTLEPVADHIEEDFEGWFLDESQASSFQRAKKRKMEVEQGDMPLEENENPIPEENDDPEPVIGGMIEIGELVAQYLSLALNPYPHSETALEKGPIGEEIDLKKPGPFDVLKELKK